MEKVQNMNKQYNTHTSDDLPFRTKGVILYRDKNMKKWRPLPYRIANLMYRGYLCLGGKGNIIQLSTLFKGNREYYDTLELYNSEVVTEIPAVQFTELITYFLACVDNNFKTEIIYDTKENYFNFNMNTLRMLEPVDLKRLNKEKEELNKRHQLDK